MSDAEVAQTTGRTFGGVWAKRRERGIPQPSLKFRHWTPAEDELVGTAPDAEIGARLGRTATAVHSSRAILERERARSETNQVVSDPAPCPDVLQALQSRPIAVPRDRSPADDDRFKLIGGPYYPPRTDRGRFLVCELRGKVKVGGYSDAPIPWPRIWQRRSLVLCGDLVRGLRTESVLAVAYHWGLSRAIVSYYRQQFRIERYTLGSYRLFRKTIDAARTPAARAKLVAAREGKPSLQSAASRERLRTIQSLPKPAEFKRRESERLRRRFALLGPFPRWTPDQIALIGTMQDREVARRTGHTLMAVRAKKFAIRGQRTK